MPKCLIIFCFSFLNITFCFAQKTIIAYGSEWKYFDLERAPEPQSTLEWTDLNYNDDNWFTGPAQLGYGDGDESTVLNEDALTVYLRKTFEVDDLNNINNMEIELLYDDGAIVYLNGEEIWRVNMPAGNISYNTYSAGQSSDNARISMAYDNLLSVGTNMIAVEVHQRSTGSSDISFDLSLSTLTSAQIRIIRGPYIQKTTPSSAIVKWRTNEPTASVIHYGLDRGSLTSKVEETLLAVDHEIQIDNLQSETVYYYSVANNDLILLNAQEDLFFRTHPIINSSGKLRAWVLGDCGTANGDARKVRDAYYDYVDDKTTDMVLFLGDNAYTDGTDNEYQYAIFEDMYEDILKNTCSWSCLGNHDGRSADSGDQTGVYYDIFSFPKFGESGGVPTGTEAYYSFDFGNVHFISLDSYDSDRSTDGQMYAWCKNDLENTEADWIIAFWHHPPYSKGSHNSDSESRLVDMRENFLPLLEANGVDLVLSGHSHSYERSYFLNGHYGTSNSFDPLIHTVGQTGYGDGKVSGSGAYQKPLSGDMTGQGAVYIIAGSSGKVSDGDLNHKAMYYSVKALGSCILEIDQDSLKVKFIRETGDIDDFFTIVRSDPDCLIGDACDDGDICTEDDVIDNHCECTGVFSDDDGDGICNAMDQCPLFDDSLIGTACDDGDPCTAEDKYSLDCECKGVYLDNDNDGYCVGEDPNDLSPCVPDRWGINCNHCTILLNDNFEDLQSNWQVNIGNGAFSDAYALDGQNSYFIEKTNSFNAAMITQVTNLNQVDIVSIDLPFLTENFANDDAIHIAYSNDGGLSFTWLYTWKFGVDFTNESWIQTKLDWQGRMFGKNCLIRISTQSTKPASRVYFDLISISDCPIINDAPEDLPGHLAIAEREEAANILVFPNPTNDILNIEFGNRESNIELQITDVLGDVIIRKTIIQAVYSTRLNVENLPGGLYILNIKRGENQLCQYKVLVH